MPGDSDRLADHYRNLGLEWRQKGDAETLEQQVETISRDAPGVHAAMLEAARVFAKPNGWRHAEGSIGEQGGDRGLVSWLGEAQRDPVLSILSAGNRIPEEVLRPEELEQVWHAGV